LAHGFAAGISTRVLLSCRTGNGSPWWWLANFHAVRSAETTAEVLAVYGMYTVWAMAHASESFEGRHDQVQVVARDARWSTVLCSALSGSADHD